MTSDTETTKPDDMPESVYLADKDEDLEHSHRPSSHWKHEYVPKAAIMQSLARLRDAFVITEEDVQKAIESGAVSDPDFVADFVLEQHEAALAELKAKHKEEMLGLLDEANLYLVGEQYCRLEEAIKQRIGDSYE